MTIMRLCTCGRKVPTNERCECQRDSKRQRDQRHDRKRPSARARGYDRVWQQARREFLQAHPYCMHNGCGRPATIVHHTIRHKGNPRLFWNRALWLPVCQPCHDGPLQSQERQP